MYECLFCGYNKARHERENRDGLRVLCPVCGAYKISNSMRTTLENATELPAVRHLIAGLIREVADRGGEFEIANTSLAELLDQASPPRDPFDAIDRLLLRIHARTEDPVSYVSVPPGWYPVVYGKGVKHLDHYLQHLQKIGWIEDSHLRQYRLTLDGWRRIRELRALGSDSNQAFVAMWFSDEMSEVWKEGFKPALEAVGFSPLRIDMVHHNEKIDDRIIAEIRGSGLLVADFTGGRGGVYFEAGFAMGLGIPVVWTCRNDWVEKLHFDTRQYNHITWADPLELQEKVRLRIEATIPGRATAGSQQA